MAAEPLTVEIQALFQRLHNELEAAQGEIPNLSPQGQVDVGQALWDMAGEVQEVLGTLKELFREEALNQGHEPRRVFFHGQSRARCTVVIPAASVRLRPDITPTAVRKVLGDAFSLFFAETLQPRSDFASQAAQHPDFLQVLAELVDTRSDVPRVTFLDRGF